MREAEADPQGRDQNFGPKLEGRGQWYEAEDKI